jgi:DNA-3-methyladenine glycosylase
VKRRARDTGRAEERGIEPGRLRRLRRGELPLDTRELARFLLGKCVVRRRGARTLVGRIVETEAYPPGDPAGHAFRGETERNASLFLERGHAYVYFAYGSCFCFNVSSETPGVGAGVLVRALEPLAGLASMQELRPTARRPIDLTRGPGRLAAALDVDRRLDGVDLCAGGPLWLADAARPPAAVGASVRIGITRAADAVLRFYERGNPHVSGPRSLRP